MKIRRRWKPFFRDFFLVFLILLSISGQWSGVKSQGTRSTFPGGFQPFRPLPLHHNQHQGVATSVQNRDYGFFPSANTNARNFPRAPPTANARNSNVQKEAQQYEYYDEPEQEEVLYQYEQEQEARLQPRPSGGRGTLNLPPQTITTAHRGKNHPASGFFRETSAPNQHQVPKGAFIPLEEPDQPLLLNGRSVPPQSPSLNRVSSYNINIRPPAGLLRPSPTPISSTTIADATTEKKSRGRFQTSPTSAAPVAVTVRSRFSPTGTKKPPTASTTKRSHPAPAPSASSASQEGDYTIEYIEYPASPEDPSSNKGQFDYYEVSEETAKAILMERELKEKNKKKTAPTANPNPNSNPPNTKVSSSRSTSVSTSSSMSVTTSNAGPSHVVTKSVSTTTPKPTPVQQKVVVSVSSTKTVGSSSNKPVETTVRTSTTTSTTTTTTPAPTTTTSTTTTTTEKPPKSSTPVLFRDSIPSGAETSPEYYEEEYSYPEKIRDGKQEVSQPRKLPSKKKDEDFETLLDFGDTYVPIIEDNVQKEVKPLEIKFAEISPDLLPPGFKFPPEEEPSSTTTSITTTTTTAKPRPQFQPKPAISFDDVPAFLLPKGYKPVGTTAATTTTTAKPTTTTEKAVIDFGNIPLNLLPKGFKLPPTAETPTSTANPLELLLSKVKFTEIGSAPLLPKDYKEPVIPPNLLPPGYKPLPSKEEEAPIPPNLLPPGFKPSSESSGSVPSSPTTKKPGGLIFPTKPGGFRVTRPTTTETPKGDTPPPPRVAIAGGWPVRKTTEFTGWPTPKTTPMPSTEAPPPTPSTTTEGKTTTTTTPTTTTPPPPPKRSPLGTCPQDICRMEATIRITGGVKWKPEFADINTEEYKRLENTLRRELDGVYRASGLAPWYKRVQIEGFNQGSVLVDYWVELEGVDRELTTQDVLKVFHKSILDSDPGDELPIEPDDPVGLGALRFGRYNIDPRYTDFKVVNIRAGKTGAVGPEPLIPQWGIAVIVIGLVSLLFVFILGLIVLVSRYKSSKKKNAVSLTQEMLNEFNKVHNLGGGGGGMHSSSGGVENFGADDLYNMDDVWNDGGKLDRTFDRRPPKQRSQGRGSTKGFPPPNYNIYDSWKTEWNGYYYSGNYYGDSGYAPSRRRSDYDTNF